jgi:hypothetical protein
LTKSFRIEGYADIPQKKKNKEEERRRRRKPRSSIHLASFPMANWGLVVPSVLLTGLAISCVASDIVPGYGRRHPVIRV